jgi:hypothetical protein
MDRKAERLVLILEGIALVTALILILVDYKLKNDLTELYAKMEATLADGQKLFAKDAGTSGDSLRLRSGDLVGNGPTVEKATDTGLAGQNGKPPTRSASPAKRSRRVGDKAVSDDGKQMGS